VRGSRVDVRLEMTATVETCRAGAFDTVVVATGGTRMLDGLPRGGVSVDDMGPWLSNGGDEVGRRVVIVGGDRGALAVARRCTEHDRDVSVVEPSLVFAIDMGLPGRFRAVFETEQCGAALLPDADTAARATLAADTVIVAGPVHPRRALFDQLVAAGIDAHAVGDCRGDQPEGTGGIEAAFAAVARLVATFRE